MGTRIGKNVLACVELTAYENVIPGRGPPQAAESPE